MTLSNSGPVATTSGKTAATGPVLTFIAVGNPKPKGSLRHVGNGRLVEQVNGTPWRRTVRDAAVDAASYTDAWPLTGPLHVEAAFTFAKPVSAPKRRRSWPITRATGDLDKQLRNLFDALVDAGVIRDDAQITDVTAAKRYLSEGPDALTFPGVVVHIHALTDHTGG